LRVWFILKSSAFLSVKVCISFFNHPFQDFHFIDLLQEFVDFRDLDVLGLLEEASATGGLCASGGVGEGKLEQ
jgi:hypothetical protein